MHKPKAQSRARIELRRTLRAGRRDRAPKHRLVGGRYAVESRLGIGGMAEVVLARDPALDRLVALKLLAPALAVDPLFVERFRREATAIASLNHANVVVIHDHGMAEGQPFIAMEYVAGRTLKQLITDGAPLPPGRRAAMRLRRSPAWRLRMRSASSTATSSPRTSSCARTAR